MPTNNATAPGNTKSEDELRGVAQQRPVQFESGSPVSQQEFENQSESDFQMRQLPERFTKDSAFYTSFLRLREGEDDERGVGGTYLSVKNQMDRGNLPPEVAHIRERIEQEERDLDREAARQVLVDPGATDEEKQETMEGFQALQQAGRPTDDDPLSRRFTEEVASVDDESTNSGSSIQTERVRSSEEIRNHNRELGQLVSTAFEQADENDSVWTDIMEFTEIVTPFVEQTDLYQIAEESGLVDFGPVDAALMGSFKRRLADEIINIEDPERKRQAYERLLNAAKNKSGVAPYNENNIAMIAELEGVLRTGTAGPSMAEVTIDNVISVLDLVGVGQIAGELANSLGLAARGARVGRSAREGVSPVDEAAPRPSPPQLPAPRETEPAEAASRKPRVKPSPRRPAGDKPHFVLKPSTEEAVGTPRGSPMDNATRSNPGVGGRLGAAAVADETGNVADAMGTTREDIVFDIGPKPWGYDIDGAIPRVQPFLHQLRNFEETVHRELDSFGGLLTGREKELARRQFWNNIDNIAGMKTHLGKSQMRYNEEGLDVRAVYGPNGEHGFARFDDAEGTRSNRFGSDDPDSRIEFHDVRTGEVRHVSPADAANIRRTDQSTGIHLEPTGTRGKYSNVRFSDTDGRTIAKGAVRQEGDVLRIRDMKDSSGEDLAVSSNVDTETVESVGRLLKREFPDTARFDDLRHPDSTRFGSMDPNRMDTSLPGEFYVQKEYRTPYDTIKGHVFLENPTDNNIPFTSARMPARLSIGMLDASSRFADFIRLGTFTAAETGSLIERKLVRDVSKMLPSTDRQRQILNEALMKGDEEQTRYTDRVLHARFGLSSQGIAGYHAMRSAFDVLWGLQNRDMRKGMLEGGYNRMIDAPEISGAPVRIADSGEEAARDIRDALDDLADTNSIDVTDVVTGNSVTLTPDEALRAYERGEGQLARLFQRSFTENGANRYVWIPKGELDNSVNIRSLPQHVMPYREGHVPRFYNANWFVDRVLKNPKVDGRRPSEAAIRRGDFHHTLGASKSQRGAEEHRQKLMREAEEAGDTAKYDFLVRPDRSRHRSPADRTKRDMEVMTARGLSTQRRRGEHLVSASGKPELDYVNAEVDDPWSAFLRSSKAVSRHVTHKRVSDHLRRRFVSTYGDITNGRIPDSAAGIDQLARENNITSTKRINDAMNFRQHIELFDRMPNSSGFDQGWHDAWYGVADSLESGTRGLPDFIPQGARKIGDLTPTQKLKSTAFTTYLALNPQRQFMVQAGQLLQLGAVEPKYVFSGGLYKDIMAVTVGAMARNHGGDVFEQTAKMGASMMGESVDNYKRILNALMDRSGIPWNVDQHLLVNAFTDPYTTNKAMSREWWRKSMEMPVRGAQRGIQASKKVGFDAGELANVTGSWLAGRRRWLRNNPNKADEWDSITNLREVNLQGRELSWSMIAPGRFVWQDGMISAVMQFMSIPVKGMLAGTTSNVMSRAEKARFWGNNLALFGPYSIPIVGVLTQKAIEETTSEPLPQQARRGLEGGVMDIMWNTAADTAFNERSENDMLVAHNFSPMAQTSDNITRLWENTDRSALEFMTQTVPGVSAGSRIYESFAEVGNVFSAVEADQMTGSEAIKASLKSISMIPSGISNYWKFNFAKKTGMSVSRNGDPSVELARGEALGTLFGIQSADERDYYEAIGTTIDRNESIKNDAKTIYDFWKQQEILLGSGSLNDRDKAARYEALHTLLSVYPKEDRDDLYQEFRQLNRYDRERGDMNVKGMILDRIARTRGAGGMDGIEGVKNEIKQNEALTNEMREDLLSIVDRMFALPESGNVDPHSNDD